MGRTNPTFRDRIRALEDDWQSYRSGLRKRDQPAFDACFDAAAAHADAAGYQNPVDPWPAVLLSILIEQQRRIDSLEQHIEIITHDDSFE